VDPLICPKCGGLIKIITVLRFIQISLLMLMISGIIFHINQFIIININTIGDKENP